MRQGDHSWVVVDSLVTLHFLDSLWLDSCIGPVQIPIYSFVVVELVVLLSTGLFDDSVFSLASTQDKLLLRLFLLGFIFNDLAVFIFLDESFGFSFLLLQVLLFLPHFF